MVLLKVRSALLLIGAACLPIYVLGSGGIQPAHAVLVLFAALTFLAKGFPVAIWWRLMLLMAFYSFAVETFYAFSGGDPRFVVNSIFFLYNAIIAGALYQHVKCKGLSTLPTGIAIAGVIAIVTVLNTGVDFREYNEAGRSTGTFNNPNQLGYFSVCLLSFTYLFVRTGKLNYWLSLCLFAVSLLLSIFSLSKAAMISNFLVIFFALKPTGVRSLAVDNRSSRASLITWLVLALVGIMFVLLLVNSGSLDGFLFVERLVGMAQESDSSLASRGYFAFLDGSAAQILFGLGTQNVEDVLGHEVHSTFASTLNNYGLLGFMTFLSICGIWAMRLWKFYGIVGLICLAGPPMLYGITHNGTRFAIFWLLFAASLSMTQRREPEKAVLSTVVASRKPFATKSEA